MFYEEIRTKQDLSYISICSLSILYNSKFILMATSLGTNSAVVTRVHCILYGSVESILHDQVQLMVVFSSVADRCPLSVNPTLSDTC